MLAAVCCSSTLLSPFFQSYFGHYHVQPACFDTIRKWLPFSYHCSVLALVIHFLLKSGISDALLFINYPRVKELNISSCLWWKFSRAGKNFWTCCQRITGWEGICGYNSVWSILSSWLECAGIQAKLAWPTILFMVVMVTKISLAGAYCIFYH